ncbi:MFS transporter [Gluconacetobacter sp. Hr-1-5]|uniref:MFS transporter n=1 Tax=Gluconacetobacter sp. Hr-1-5 TaxID=3395370 RepID=UPI003B51CE27
MTSAKGKSPATGLFMIAACAGVANASLLCAPVLATQLMAELGYDARRTGLFFSLEFAGYCLAGLFGRMALPRFGWPLLLRAAILTAIAGNLFALACLHHPDILLAARLLTATGNALMGIVAMSYANIHPRGRQAYGVYIMGQCVAGTLGLIFLPTLFLHTGIAAYFLLLPCLLTLLLFGASRLPPGRTLHESGGSSRSAPASGWHVTIRRLAVLLFYVGLSAIWTFSGQLALAAGFNAQHSGYMLGLAAGFGILGSSAATWLGKDAYSDRSLALAGYGLLTASLLMLLWPWAPSFVVGTLLFKFSWTFVVPVLFAIVGRQDRSGEVVAEINFIAGLGLAVAPWAGGQILYYGDLKSLTTISIVFVLISAWCAARLASQEQH